MRRFKLWIIFVLLPWLALFGCATMPTVLLTACIIPPQLDYVASGAPDLSETMPLPPRDALQVWAGDRHLLRGLADDYNDLIKHVKGQCQK